MRGGDLVGRYLVGGDRVGRDRVGRYLVGGDRVGGDRVVPNIAPFHRQRSWQTSDMGGMSSRSFAPSPSRRSGRRAASGAQLTLDDARVASGRGGWRPGAGRPRGRTKVAHGRRERFAARYPQHVTLRVVGGVESLRRHRSMRVVRRALLAGGHRPTFRVIEFSVQSNQLHLIVEAGGADGLTRGMIGLAVRLARRLNRAFGRSGRLFAERYHARSLRTPTEVRNAIRHVLQNHQHHARRAGVSAAALHAAALDPCSSSVWFDGWAVRLDPREGGRGSCSLWVALPPPLRSGC